MVMDLKKLADIMDQEIIERVDHKHLNHDVDFLRGVIPTAENLAIAFWRILEPKITEGLAAVRSSCTSPPTILSSTGEPEHT